MAFNSSLRIFSTTGPVTGATADSPINHVLRGFDDFAALKWDQLSTVAAHTRLICVPGNRWILQPGHRLSGAYYLLRGRVQLPLENEFWEAGQCRARAALYPGRRAIKSVNSVQLLQVDLAPIAFLLGEYPFSADLLQRSEPWVLKFLASHTMQHLQQQQWQQVLKRMKPMPVRRAQRVIQMGERGEFCYVLKQGSARVHRDQVQLAQLGPGDFFGEDAVISKGIRNAHVTMTQAGELMAIAKLPFREFVVSSVVRFVQSQAQHQLLQLSDSEQANEALSLHDLREGIDKLSYKSSYVVCGSSLAECALAVFLLIQRGHKASVLLDQ